MANLLSEIERDALLAPLLQAGWARVERRDAIEKRFEFKSFVAAFGWMTQVALWAEKLDHHPEWRNVYRHVDVCLITHDCGGLSVLDIELASRMEALAGNI